MKMRAMVASVVGFFVIVLCQSARGDDADDLAALAELRSRMNDAEFRDGRTRAINLLRDAGTQFNQYNSTLVSQAGLEGPCFIGIYYHVSYLDEWDPTTAPEKVDDKLLRDTLPFLPELASIDLPMTKVTSAGLEVLTHLRFLSGLSIYTHDSNRYPSFIGDDGLKHIGKCSNLRILDLAGLPVTDSGIAHLKHLPKLQFLELVRTQITTDCLEHIATMPSLKSLVFGWIPLPHQPDVVVTDFSKEPSAAVRKAVPKLDGHLNRVSFYGTVNSEVVLLFAKVKSLRHVGLMHTNLTDDTLADFLELRGSPIETLGFSITDISDRSRELLRLYSPGSLRPEIGTLPSTP